MTENDEATSNTVLIDRKQRREVGAGGEVGC